MTSPCEQRDRCHPVAAAAKVWRLSLIAFLIPVYSISAADVRPATIEMLQSHVAEQSAKLSDGEKAYIKIRLGGDQPTTNWRKLEEDTWGPPDEAIKVLQVMGPSSARIKYWECELFWSGPTDGWADDRIVDISKRLIFIHGTQTRFGGTLRVIHAVDGESLKDFIASSDLLRRANKFESVGEASFMEIKGGQAVFVLMNGSTRKVPTGELSSADRSWVDEFNAKEVASRRQQEKDRKAAAVKRKR